MSRAWKQEAFVENTKMVEDFASEHGIKIEYLNSGYQMRLGGVIDIYPVRKKWHYLVDGTRGEFDDISELDVSIFNSNYTVTNNNGKMTYPENDGVKIPETVYIVQARVERRWFRKVVRVVISDGDYDWGFDNSATFTASELEKRFSKFYRKKD